MAKDDSFVLRWTVIVMTIGVMLGTLSKAAAQESCAAEGGEREGCLSFWKWDVTKEACEARGCCWDAKAYEKRGKEEWCYYGNGNRTKIDKVYVVQGCHIDVGFVQSMVNIINLWFNVYFERALVVGQELTHMGNPGGASLQFNFPSWLVSLYLECPLEYRLQGVQCPNASAVAAVKTGIEKGYITWYAYPFNVQAEMMDSSMFRFGVQLSHQLDRQFGFPPKQTFSQRDVPGTTSSVIPLLKAEGVQAMNFGSNGRSEERR